MSSPSVSLSELLTAEQLSLLGAELQRVLEHGFGDVTITVNRGHVRFVRAALSHELPAGSLRPAPEDGSLVDSN
jgi:hypothetical protein